MNGLQSCSFFKEESMALCPSFAGFSPFLGVSGCDLSGALSDNQRSGWCGFVRTFSPLHTAHVLYLVAVKTCEKWEVIFNRELGSVSAQN